MLGLLMAAALQSAAVASPNLPCDLGVYEAPDGEIVAIANGYKVGRKHNGTVDLIPEVRYTFLDGRRGPLDDRGSPLDCKGSVLRAADATGRTLQWRKQQLRLTWTHFQRDGVTFAGELIEPEKSRGKPPLTVTVAGSENAGTIGTAYPYLLAGKGIAVFTYDKRGTGGSTGRYNQNFEMLGADAAAAMVEARRLYAGRYSRAGFWGGSQGGWVAPLGAYLSHADFVVVGYGEIMNPLEEDAEQVFDELRNKGYGAEAIGEAREVTNATGDVMASHFTAHYDELSAVKRKYADQPWFNQIQGEFTGDVLKTDEQTLRRTGREQFDNLQIDWRYDALGLMEKLNIPQLWVLAGSDREAPVPLTIQRLALLQLQGKPIRVMIFPHTDHGITEFIQAADGTRTTTRVAPGYYRMVTDWIKGDWRPPYDHAYPFNRLPASGLKRPSGSGRPVASPSE